MQGAETTPLFEARVDGAESLGAITDRGVVVQGADGCWVLSKDLERVVAAAKRCSVFASPSAAALAEEARFSATSLDAKWSEAKDERFLAAESSKDRLLLLSSRLPESRDAAVRARLVALDGSGRRSWELPLLPFDLEAPPTRGAILTSRAALFVALNDVLLRVDPRQGSVDWHRVLPGKSSESRGRFIDGGKLGALFVEGDRITSIDESGVRWQRTPHAGSTIENAAVASGHWIIDYRAKEERVITSITTDGESEWSIIRGDPEPRVPGMAVFDDRVVIGAGARVVLIDTVKGFASVVDRYEPGSYSALVPRKNVAAFVGPSRIDARASDGTSKFSVTRSEGWSDFAIPVEDGRYAISRLDDAVRLTDLEEGLGIELETDDVPSGCTATAVVDDEPTWVVELLTGSCEAANTVRAFSLRQEG